MSEEEAPARDLPTRNGLAPAVPLWRIAPTRDQDGRCLADFMMLIPRLGSRPAAAREEVARRVCEVCEAYRGQVVFAEVNYALNTLWVSVTAEPGLAGRVAQSIRGRIPEARLVGGQLGAVPMPMPVAVAGSTGLVGRLRGLRRRVLRRLAGPGG
jgi:hypothetical protein